MTSTPPSVPGHAIAIRVIDAPKVETQGRAKILLLKLGERIGDFVTAIDGFRIIREAFPQAEITLICLPDIIALAESTGLFDRVVGFAYVRALLDVSVPQMDIEDQEAAFAELLNGPYFLAADLRYDASTRKWLDLVDARYRAGYMAHTRHGLDVSLPMMEWNVPYTQISHKNLPPHASTRTALLAHAIVAELRAEAVNGELFTLSQEVTANPAYLSLKSEKRFKVGLSVGAGSELRKWPLDYWVAFMHRLMQERDVLLVFFGGKGDKPDTQAIMEKLPPDSCLDLTSSLPLASLPAYMNLLDAYVGCDTGLTHMAGKLDLPVINIFAGIGGPAVWRTRGAKVKTIYAEVICAPCHLRFKKDCPNNHVCMNAIIPGIVYDCFEKLVGKVASAL